MRFRWFFLGYLLMFSIPVGDIKILPALGYALMLYAALRLSKYEEAFERAEKVLYAALPIGVVMLVLEIFLTVNGTDAMPALSVIHDWVSFADELIEAAVMFFVYIGVKIMGDKTDIPALVKHSSRNMSVMFVYLFSTIALFVIRKIDPTILANDNLKLLLLLPFILGFLWRVLNLWMLFTCFLGIADTEDEKKRERAEREKEKARERAKRK